MKLLNSDKTAIKTLIRRNKTKQIKLFDLFSLNNRGIKSDFRKGKSQFISQKSDNRMLLISTHFKSLLNQETNEINI